MNTDLHGCFAGGASSPNETPMSCGLHRFEEPYVVEAGLVHSDFPQVQWKARSERPAPPALSAQIHSVWGREPVPPNIHIDPRPSAVKS